MSSRNTWMFDIKRKDNQTQIARLCFHGVDSEEALETGKNWAKGKYPYELSFSLVDRGEITRNEVLRIQRKKEAEYAAGIKKDFASRIRRIQTVVPIKES